MSTDARRVRDRPSGRRMARLAALQALYEVSAVAHDPYEAFANVTAELGLTKQAEEYARSLVQGVLRHKEQIDAPIAELAPTWPIHQMALVDRNILSVAIYEIMFGGETPPRVAINEAVDLARAFGSDNSPKFVNGVLGSLVERVGA